MKHSQKVHHLCCAKPARRAQQGMATLLIVLLIGVALVSVSLGAMHVIRGNQERQIAAHAQVNAQAGAWAAAEAVRRYILTLDADEVAALPLNQRWVVSGYGGLSQTVTFTEVEGPISVSGETAYRIDARVTSVADTAGSSSVLELVYQTFPETQGVSSPSVAAVNYYGDLNLTGGITVYKDAGDTTPYEINVIGNVSIGSTSVTGVDVIRSTASVNIEGGTSYFDAIYANGDVRISGGTAPRNIQATRHICLTSTTRYGGMCDSVDIRANGSVLLDRAETVGSLKCGHNAVFALAGKGEGNLHIAAGARKVCEDEVRGRFGAAAVDPTNSAVAGGVYAYNNARAVVIRSNADVILDHEVNVHQIHAERNINIVGNGVRIFDAIVNEVTTPGFARYGGTINAHDQNAYDVVFGVGNSSGKDQKEQNYNFGLEPARRVSLQSERFDVRDYKDQANYVFWRDEHGDIRIRVRDVSVNGVPIDIVAGYLGNEDWVCEEKPNNQWETPVGCLFRVARSGDAAGKKTVIQFHEWSNGWGFDNHPGSTIAPGLVYFEGNLNIPSGTFYNTFLATGNITNSGDAVAYSLNFAGYSGKQIVDGVQVTYAPQGVCQNTLIPNVVPTQFCINGEYQYNAVRGIGNYSLMAGTCGGVNNCTKEQYIGGDIKTAASANFYGAIKAGNMFVSSGNTTIHGYISALAQGVQNDQHQMGAQTNIDFRSMPLGYDPTGGGTIPGAVTPSTPTSVGILWSRYL